MAGHSKFKNIMHRKGAQDKKRAKSFFTSWEEKYLFHRKDRRRQIQRVTYDLRSAINAAKALKYAQR